MATRVCTWLLGGWLWAALAPVGAARLEVPNASFEQGVDLPVGWTLSGGQGEWLSGLAADGRRAVAVVGSGADTNAWRSGPLAFVPGSVYRLSFRARGLGAAGGTAISGPEFANDDLGTLPDSWRAYQSVFVTPREVRPDEAHLRFGQWHCAGKLAFDAVELLAAQPLYRQAGELTLGAGEETNGASYRFVAPLGGESGNQSRPLAWHQCRFNSNRWVFGADSEVVYRHALPGRRLTSAQVGVDVNYHTGGELVVQASTDGRTWRDLGTQGKVGGLELNVPADLLPASELWVRLLARARQRVGQNSDPGSFQVHAYRCAATLDQAAPVLRGETRFVAIAAEDPRLGVRLLGLGDGLPGGDNVLTAATDNQTGTPARLKLTLGGQTVETTVAPGRATVRLPYLVPDAGTWDVALRVATGAETRFAAATQLAVAELHRASYGQMLPGSSAACGLWWCDSGWKVSRTRPLPAAAGDAVVLHLARHEAEAAQVVLRPGQPLRGLRPVPGELVGPGGARLPASCLEVLRVRYVDIAEPTDQTGTAAPWPDPLPPFSAPVDLPAGVNQPLWLRLTVPRDAAPGVYRGTLALEAQGWRATVPLRVEVYGFTLPDQMTCQTAFGFDAHTAFRYQRVTDPAQRRLVLDKYLRNLAAHHISPYNPAPLDPFKVTWKGGDGWQGGRRVTDERHGGAASRLVEDDSPTAGAAVRWDEPLPIGPQGLRLRVWYKTKAPGHETILTLNHRDADGQWMSGRNNDMRVRGDGGWQLFERTVTSFPTGARSVTLALWATLYAEPHHPTGTVWYDDVSVVDVASGRELLRGGDFEAAPSPDALTPTIDWTAWDAALTKAIDEYHFNSFSVPIQGMGGGTFHSRHEPELLGYREGTPEYRAAFGAYCRAVESHLRAKGWLDKAFVYWFDEPDPKDYAFVMAGMQRLKEHAPGLARMLTEQPEPALHGGPNLWCPISNEFREDVAAARRKAGDRFWWYICCGPRAPFCGEFIDHAGTELRVWLWQTWQRRIEGILVWATNYWTSEAAYPKTLQNPYEDPMSWVSGYDTPAGTRAPWGNGDGRFIYPPEAAADGHPAQPVLDGPVDSVRWELLRDGIEDYEYLAMLQRLLAAKGARLPAGERQALAALLEVPPELTANATTFTRDPEVIARRRHAVARGVERLTLR